MRAHVPTEETRATVRMHATVGTKFDNIARLLGIDKKTMRKHYRDELDLGKDQANAVIGGALFNKAKNGDTAAQIFWMKTQARWHERHDFTSSDGSMSPQQIVIRAADEPSDG